MVPRKSTKPAAVPEAEATGTVPQKAPRKAPLKLSETKAASPRSRKAPAVPELPPAVPEAPLAVKAPRKARAPKAAVEPLTEAPAEPLVETPAEAPAPQVAAPAPASVQELLTEQAAAVLLAIQSGSAVELLFVDAESNPPRTFEPRQLIFDTFAKGWYVWGWDRRYNAERHHRLDLIAQVGPVEGMGRAAQGPYKEGTPANLVGGWLGGEPIPVKVILLKQWIFAVRQAPAPFPDFKIEEQEEGKAQVTFTGTDLRAISRWAMQFGDGIQVIEPQRLQDRIKQVGIAWGGKPAAERPAPERPAPSPSRSPRAEGSHRPESRSEHRNEHRAEHRPERPERSEHRSEPRESAPEPRRRPEPPRQAQEAPRPSSKSGKIEIRIDRL